MVPRQCSDLLLVFRLAAHSAWQTWQQAESTKSHVGVVTRPELVNLFFRFVFGATIFLLQDS